MQYHTMTKFEFDNTIEIGKVQFPFSIHNLNSYDASNKLYDFNKLDIVLNYISKLNEIAFNLTI